MEPELTPESLSAHVAAEDKTYDVVSTEDATSLDVADFNEACLWSDADATLHADFLLEWNSDFVHRLENFTEFIEEFIVGPSFADLPAPPNPDDMESDEILLARLRSSAAAVEDAFRCLVNCVDESTVSLPEETPSVVDDLGMDDSHLAQMDQDQDGLDLPEWFLHLADRLECDGQFASMIYHKCQQKEFVLIETAYTLVMNAPMTASQLVVALDILEKMQLSSQPGHDDLVKILIDHGELQLRKPTWKVLRLLMKKAIDSLPCDEVLNLNGVLDIVKSRV
eukprot:TRINITY_DN20481_c0_g1_i1.p1 TRINITY_DN20481_c0_g1~~TRINITY_DN20481_c0_g1_i1.p1  ORF type:complete len:281 (-),score=56.35 TRINITY_DN20481_c0_g1_i1:157-999(-)